MNRRCATVFLLALWILGAGATVRGEEPADESVPAEAVGGSAVTQVLEGVRADLLEARLDRALVSLDALLAAEDLTEADRVEALALRAQAHGATGAFDDAEADYRQILTIRPGFEPDTAATAKRAMQRFEKARAALVGTVELEIDPPDALVLVDGVAVKPGPDRRVRVRAGARSVRVERRGFDPAEWTVDVPAGGAAPLRAELVPNARTVVIRTDIDDVEVRIDDVSVGRTARVDDPDPVVRATRPAELVLEAVPAGEHVLTLERPCYRTVTLRELVAVDVLDRSPKVVGPVILQAARTVVEFRNAPATGEVRVDDERIVDLPAEAMPEVCAGRRRIEVRSGGRSVWSGIVEVPAGERLPVDVGARPNAVLVGATRWPAGLAGLERSWSTIESVARPEGADLTTREGWSSVELPVETDLAVAVLPQEGAGASDRWVLYSPILGLVTPFGVAPDPAPPRWREPGLGLRIVDAPRGGVLVAVVQPGGPAASASISRGESIVKVADQSVEDRNAWARTIAARGGEAEWVLEVVSVGGAHRTVRVRPTDACRAGLPPADALERSIHAAWSAAVGAAGGVDAPAAWTDLGTILESEGRLAGALDALRRAVWPERSGLGPGTVQYLTGRVLAAMGRDDEARDAFRKAAEGRGRMFDDDGPDVAPAARDHLADLGIAR